MSSVVEIDYVVSLDYAAISSSPVERFGAKAANLALARRAGLPVLPGLVLTTDAVKIFADERHPAHGLVTTSWLAKTSELAGQFNGRLVVRSTSPLEDRADESREGFYTSVVDVSGGDAIHEATNEVIESAGREEMAVLAQPLVESLVSGVLFGIDPVTGDEGRLLIAVVNGLPEKLVSGETTASQYHVSRRGRVLAVEFPEDAGVAILKRTTVRHLARLAREAAREFNSPQDVEWAVDQRGKLWMLQSRPVTTRAKKPSEPGVFGTGGVDETPSDPFSL
jgi:phosphoenolpyruvate synthase/pyruvate phosphate dikinase